jgi:uncharacterized protein with ATP-grasp and redox domains
MENDKDLFSTLDELVHPFKLDNDLEPFIHYIPNENYIPGLWNLKEDAEMRTVWQNRFRKNISQYIELYAKYGSDQDQQLIYMWADDMMVFLDAWIEEPFIDFYPTVWHLTLVRETLLRAYGFYDPYAEPKRIGTEQALKVEIPKNIDPIDAIVAANWFDLASPQVTQQFHNNDLHFDTLLNQLAQNDWLFDDRKKAEQWIIKHPGKVVILVDNAGVDIVCGVGYFCNWILELGWTVVLTANRKPALNDILATELEKLLPTIADKYPNIKKAISNKKISVVESGSITPGFIPTHVNPALNQAAKDATLMIIIGQGRGVETTWCNVAFDIPALRLCTIKSPVVAPRIGGKPKDAICLLQEPHQLLSLPK